MESNTVSVDGKKITFGDAEFAFEPNDPLEVERWHDEMLIGKRIIQDLTLAESTIASGESDVYEGVRQKLRTIITEHTCALQEYRQTLEQVEKFITPEGFCKQFNGNGIALAETCELIYQHWMKTTPVPETAPEEAAKEGS